jgi:hypothetical protein
VRGTVEAIERKLLVDGLVLRYDTTQSDDGLASDEGVFLACSFWLVDAYVLLNRTADARRMFERLLTLCNDVGLLSEECDPGTSRLLGNFPQALSHIALINSAFNLNEVAKPASNSRSEILNAPTLKGRDRGDADVYQHADTNGRVGTRRGPAVQPASAELVIEAFGGEIPLLLGDPFLQPEMRSNDEFRHGLPPLAFSIGLSSSAELRANLEMPRISRARRYGFSVMTWMASGT